MRAEPAGVPTVEVGSVVTVRLTYAGDWPYTRTLVVVDCGEPVRRTYPNPDRTWTAPADSPLIVHLLGRRAGSSFTYRRTSDGRKVMVEVLAVLPPTFGEASPQATALKRTVAARSATSPRDTSTVVPRIDNQQMELRPATPSWVARRDPATQFERMRDRVRQAHGDLITLGNRGPLATNTGPGCLYVALTDTRQICAVLASDLRSAWAELATTDGLDPRRERAVWAPGGRDRIRALSPLLSKPSSPLRVGRPILVRSPEDWVKAPASAGIYRIHRIAADGSKEIYVLGGASCCPFSVRARPAPRSAPASARSRC